MGGLAEISLQSVPGAGAIGMGIDLPQQIALVVLLSKKSCF
jgi:hypothetical protein